MKLLLRTITKIQGWAKIHAPSNATLAVSSTSPACAVNDYEVAVEFSRKKANQIALEVAAGACERMKGEMCSKCLHSSSRRWNTLQNAP